MVNMDTNIDFVCIGCKFATVSGMEVYCMKMGRKLKDEEYYSDNCSLKKSGLL